jgi:hypothetical protein
MLGRGGGQPHAATCLGARTRAWPLRRLSCLARIAGLGVRPTHGASAPSDMSGHDNARSNRCVSIKAPVCGVLV